MAGTDPRKANPIAVSSTKQVPPRIDSWAFSFMSAAAICFLTVNTIVAAVRSWNDPRTLCFLISMHVLLMLFFCCLHIHERLPENSEKRGVLKISIWSLATALNLVFAYRVAIIMSLPLQCLVWGMAAFSSLLGFYFFFIYKSKSHNPDGGGKGADAEPLFASNAKGSAETLSVRFLP